jgi:hypothetical protein
MVAHQEAMAADGVLVVQCGWIVGFFGCATAVSAVFRLCTVRTAETAVAHPILRMSCKEPLDFHQQVRPK